MTKKTIEPEVIKAVTAETIEARRLAKEKRERDAVQEKVDRLLREQSSIHASLESAKKSVDLYTERKNEIDARVNKALAGDATAFDEPKRDNEEARVFNMSMDRSMEDMIRRGYGAGSLFRRF